MSVSFSVEYVTAGRRGHLVFRNASALDIEEFFGLFGTVEGAKIRTEAVQRATDELKASISAFCDRRHNQAPEMGALKKLITGLGKEEAFVILPAGQRTPLQDVMLEMLVAWANGDTTEEEIIEFQRLFGRVLEEYRIVNPATDRPVQIGNAPMAARVCRFCGGTKAKGATFKQRAHAISFSLGNVHLKLADECDACNGYFGAHLEPHFLALLDIPRTFLGIRGRGKRNAGLPEIDLRDGVMRHDGERMVIEVPADAVRSLDDGIAVVLQSDVQIVPERCYRTLAKFALSVIPEAELSSLAATIEWVRHGTRPQGCALPLAYQNIVPLPPSPSAQIVLYVREAEASDLPHVVGEFRLGCYLYVFVLPFSAKDERDPAFLGDDRFDGLFRHYAGTPGWRPVNFDDLEPITTPAVLRLQPSTELGKHRLAGSSGPGGE